jgi:hypothetical protein
MPFEVSDVGWQHTGHHCGASVHQVNEHVHERSLSNQQAPKNGRRGRRSRCEEGFHPVQYIGDVLLAPPVFQLTEFQWPPSAILFLLREDVDEPRAYPPPDI